MGAAAKAESNGNSETATQRRGGNGKALPLSPSLALAGAALSGALYWLAFAGMDVWPFAFIAFVPFWISVQRQPPRRAIVIGLVMGLVMSLGGFYWLLGMLQTFSGFPIPLCLVFMLLLCAYQGGRSAFSAWLFARAQARGWPAATIFVASVATGELVYPLLFPWYFAGTVHRVAPLTQVAELGGPILITTVMVLVNLGIAEALLARIERRPMHTGRLSVAIVTFALTIGFGFLRIRQTDARVHSLPEVKVGLVQANMGLLDKRQDVNEGLRRHLSMTRDLRDKQADFVVWSETSVMHALEERNANAEILSAVSRHLGIPAIFGAVLFRPDPIRRIVLYNTALSSDLKGNVTGRYDKEYLLAFGEYLPLGETFPILYQWSPNSGRFSPGTKLDPLQVELNGVRHPVSALICYEDILPGFTNKAVAYAKPELLVNITNDAWFGKTAEPWQHLALATFRAIEHRRYLVRSTNSGISAIVDPVGRVTTKSGLFTQETLFGSIRWMQSRTVYEILGDWPWYFVSVASIAVAFLKKRSRSSAA